MEEECFFKAFLLLLVFVPICLSEDINMNLCIFRNFTDSCELEDGQIQLKMSVEGCLKDTRLYISD